MNFTSKFLKATYMIYDTLTGVAHGYCFACTLARLFSRFIMLAAFILQTNKFNSKAKSVGIQYCIIILPEMLKLFTVQITFYLCVMS